MNIMSQTYKYTLTGENIFKSKYYFYSNKLNFSHTTGSCRSQSNAIKNVLNITYTTRYTDSQSGYRGCVKKHSPLFLFLSQQKIIFVTMFCQCSMKLKVKNTTLSQFLHLFNICSLFNTRRDEKTLRYR